MSKFEAIVERAKKGISSASVMAAIDELGWRSIQTDNINWPQAQALIDVIVPQVLRAVTAQIAGEELRWCLAHRAPDDHTGHEPCDAVDVLVIPLVGVPEKGET